MNSRDLSVLSAIDLSRLVCTLHGKGDSIERNSANRFRATCVYSESQRAS